MKKNAISAHFLKTQLTALRCPVCQTPFVQVADNALICQKGHSFDIAKKGSVFFLKAPVPTEYTTDMLAKRQHVIQAGLFAPVLNRIATLLQGTAVIDAGCGKVVKSKPSLPSTSATTLPLTSPSQRLT